VLFINFNLRHEEYMKIFCRLDKHNVSIRYVFVESCKGREEKIVPLSRDICYCFMKNIKSSWHTRVRAQAHTHTHTRARTNTPIMFMFSLLKYFKIFNLNDSMA
jgi:hypothetical protein